MRARKWCITGFTNSITQHAEEQGNDEGDRGEQSPGKWEGGGNWEREKLGGRNWEE